MFSLLADEVVAHCTGKRATRAVLAMVLALAAISSGCGLDEEVPLAAFDRAKRASSADSQSETRGNGGVGEASASPDSSARGGADSTPTSIAATPAVSPTPNTRIESGAGAGFRNAPFREPTFPCGPFFGGGTNYGRSFVEWTPDGARLAFEFEQQLWVVDRTGHELVRLLDANPGRRRIFGFRDGFHADISPDSQQVVYTSCNHRSDDPIPAIDGLAYEQGTPAWRERSHLNYELAVVDIDGGAPRRLTNDTRFDHFPSWSPDGTRIAFISAAADRHPSEHHELQTYMTSPGGGGVQDGDLSFGYASSGPLAWSPDGERLAFRNGALVFTVMTDISAERPTGTLETTPPALPAGGDAMPQRDASMVPQSMVTEIGPSNIPPTWSPDGEWILTASGEGAAYALIAVRADGQASKTIVTLSSIGVEVPVSEAAWSPDGSKIAFVAGGVWVVDSDGRNAHFLLHVSRGLTPPGPGHVAWSPDSKQIAAYYSGAGLLHAISLEDFEQRILVTKDATGALQAGRGVLSKGA